MYKLYLIFSFLTLKSIFNILKEKEKVAYGDMKVEVCIKQWNDKICIILCEITSRINDA